MEVKILSQTVRLNNILNCLSDQGIETCIRVGNSKIGQEIQTIRKQIGEQWSTINKCDLKYFIRDIKEILDEKIHNEKVEKLLFERKLMVEEWNEVKNNLSNDKKEHDEISRKLTFLDRQQDVLEDMIKSTSE